MRLERIKWLDACTSSAWTDRKEVAAEKLVECQTVGWVVHEDEHRIALTQTRNDSRGFGPVTWIPRGNVVSRQRLEAR